MLRISASPIATVILFDLSGDTVKGRFSEGLGEKGCNREGTTVLMCNRCDKVFLLIGLSLAGLLSMPLSVSVRIQADRQFVGLEIARNAFLYFGVFLLSFHVAIIAFCALQGARNLTEQQCSLL